MFDPLAMGLSVNAEVSDARTMRTINGVIGAKVARGSSRHNAITPSAMTERMYQRPRGGRSRKAVPVYATSLSFFLARADIEASAGDVVVVPTWRLPWTDFLADSPWCLWRLSRS